MCFYWIICFKIAIEICETVKKFNLRNKLRSIFAAFKRV